jgi:type IV secretion system protein VirD4
VSRPTGTPEVFGDQAVPPGPHRLFLLLDEFPTLGRRGDIQTALTYLAGYGIQAYLIVQDLTQLAHAYGRYEAIVSSCHVRLAFAANKVEIARLRSDMVGAMTGQRGCGRKVLTAG